MRRAARDQVELRLLAGAPRGHPGGEDREAAAGARGDGAGDRDRAEAPVTHSRIGLTPKPQHLEGGIKALMREMPSLLLPDLGNDLGITVRDQYVLGVRTLPCWQEPLPQPRYPEGDGPRARRKQYWCPAGCYAAVLASRYHLLPFTHVLAFEAPAGVFEDWWDQWLDCLVDWWVLTASLPFPEPAIWLGAMADRPGVRIPGSGEDPHVHLLVGNVPETAILAAAARWPQAPPGVKPWLTVTPLARAQRDTVKLAVLLFTLAQVRDQEIAA